LVAGDVALLVRNDDPIGSVMLRCAPWGAPPATMASPLRGGDGDRMELRASTSPFQTTHTPSPSRGVFRPSFALLITPSPNKGRREGRVPAGTHGPLCACSAKRIAQRHTGEAEHTAFPAQWFDGVCRALPGDEFVLASVTSRIDDAACPVGLPAPPQGLTVATTARTTRFCRTQASRLAPGLLRQKASQASSAVRTTRLARCSRGSAQSTAPPCHLHPRRRRSASTAARSAARDDVRPPLFAGSG
jgi:hypothetical protein